MDKEMVNKLLLLFVFDKLEVPMQEDIVVDMVVSNDWIQYVECKSAFAALVSTSFLTNVATNKAKPRYTITADGRECLRHFYTNIPSSVRDNIVEHIRDNRFTYRKKQDYFADYFKNADGSYTVVLKIESTSVQLLELKLTIQDRNNAKWIYKNWPEKATTIYEFIHENLLE